jgi:hypothetical protein
MNYHDFFTGGKKAGLRIYHLTQPLVTMRRVKGKGVPQVDKKSTMHDTEPSKAAKKIAKKIAASKELESGKNMNGPMKLNFIMVENRPIINNDGKKQFKKTEFTYTATVTLNKTTKQIKQKNGKMKPIQRRYNITVKQQNRNVIKNVGKKGKKPIKQKVVKKNKGMPNVNAVANTINQMNALLNANGNKANGNNGNRGNNANGNKANRGNNANKANNGNNANRGNNANGNKANGNKANGNNGNRGTNGNKANGNNGNNLLEGGYYYY